MADLFICHSRSDKRFVRRLAADLSILGIDVWFDEWELQVGDSLHERIGDAVRDSAYLAIVLSPSSVESRWCRAELDEALSREKQTGKKVVLPLLYRRVQPPPFLEGRLHLNFSNTYFRSLAELAAFLYHLDWRLVREALQKKPPKTLNDVRLILFKYASSSFDAKVISEKSYKRIREALEAVGVDVRTDVLEIPSINLKEHLRSFLTRNVVLLDRCLDDSNSIDKVSRAFEIRDKAGKVPIIFSALWDLESRKRKGPSEDDESAE